MNSYGTHDAARAVLDELTQDDYYGLMLPNTEYPLLGIWSKSALWKLHQDPERWALGRRTEETGQMKFGSMVDTLATEPFTFRDRYRASSYPDFRTKAARQERDELEASGVVIVRQEDIDRAQRAVERLSGSQDGINLMGGEMQKIVTAVARIDGRYGTAFVPVKSRLDSFCKESDLGPMIYDLKVTGDTTPAGLLKTCKTFGYHWQDALYSKLCHEAGFTFLFLGDSEPHHVVPVELSSGVRDAGMKGIETALRIVYELASGRPADSFRSRRFVFDLKTSFQFSSWVDRDVHVDEDTQITWTI